MDNQKEFLEYHKFIWNNAKNETNAYYRKSFQEWWADMIGAISTAFILSIYLYFRNGMEIDWIGTFLSIAGGFVFVIVCRLLINGFWIIPARIYKEKEIEANKFTWKDVSISVPIDMAKNHPLPTCLQVINKKPYDIERCIVKITSVKKGYIDLPIEENSINLSWVTDKDDERWNPTTLKSCRKEKEDEDRNFVLFANWLYENNGVFLLATNRTGFEKERANFIELAEGINYTIGLEWLGEIEGRKLDTNLNWYSLRYEKDKIYLEEVK